MLPPRDIASLEELHGYFVEQVNEAVAEGRDDCIAGLVAAYWHEAEHAVNNGPWSGDWDLDRPAREPGTGPVVCEDVPTLSRHLYDVSD